MSPKDLFIPRNSTKKRSLLLQHRTLLSYVFFVIALLLSSRFIMLSTPGILGYATDITVHDLLVYVNSKRREQGLNELVLNPALSKAAVAKAYDMFENDYWAHTSPAGKEPWDFIVGSGYDYLYAGENLAVDFSHSKNVVEAWLRSKSHRKNVLSNKYVDIGFAVVNGELNGRKTTLVVQMFGYPRDRVAAVLPPARVEGPGELAKVPSVAGKEIIEVPSVTREGLAVPQGAVLNSSDVLNVSKYLAVILGLFLSLMFAIDGYYVRKFGILRISGHTILHVIILVLMIVGIWYTSIGLVL